MTLPPGSRLGSYDIVAHLGSGGMGDVYRARDARLARDVAVKVLATEGGTRPRDRERFLREARAASALNHPNIVTVHEIGSDGDTDFIVMEFVRGRTLHAAIATGRLSLGEVTAYATQLADGLSRAHAVGIVHRDLKPGNVMITDDRLIKILDFGLAKVMAADDDAAAREVTQAALTRPGTRVGTLGYMSPEQALGAPVDARSDVFSFGIILFEMLAGRRPFEGDTSSQVLRALHLEEPPLERVRPDTPPMLRAVLRRCLEKEPADRYPNMTAVAEVMRTIAVSTAGAPSTGHASTLDAPAEVPTGRLWRIVGGAALVAVVALVAWGVARRGSVPATSEQAGSSSPVAVVETASAQDLTAQGVQLMVRQDRDADLNQAIERFERAIAADARHAPAYAHLSQAYFRRFKSSPDPQWLAIARDRAERAVALDADLAIAHLALGLVELDGGQVESAGRHLRRASELDPLNASVHMGLGHVLAAEKRDQDAEAAFRKAVDLAGGEWRPYVDLGQFFYQRARYDEALAAWERAREVTPDNLLVLRNLGAAYFRTRKYDEAASALQRALEIRPSGPVYTNLGNIHFQQGRYTEAVAAFEKALEQDANNYAYWGNLGDAYRWAAGRRPEAAPAYRRASDILQAQIAIKPADPDLRTRHALYLAKAGDLEAARGELARTDGQTLTAQMHFRVAIVRELAGDRAGALDALARAVKSGYPAGELTTEPELIALRADPRFHRLVSTPGAR